MIPLRKKLKLNQELRPWASQCGLKKSYGSLEDAVAKAKELVQRGLVTGLVGYPCPHCGLFHVGHPREEAQD